MVTDMRLFLAPLNGDCPTSGCYPGPTTGCSRAAEMCNLNPSCCDLFIFSALRQGPSATLKAPHLEVKQLPLLGCEKPGREGPVGNHNLEGYGVGKVRRHGTCRRAMLLHQPLTMHISPSVELQCEAGIRRISRRL